MNIYIYIIIIYNHRVVIIIIIIVIIIIIIIIIIVVIYIYIYLYIYIYIYIYVLLIYRLDNSIDIVSFKQKESYGTNWNTYFQEGRDDAVLIICRLPTVQSCSIIF